MRHLFFLILFTSATLFGLETHKQSDFDLYLTKEKEKAPLFIFIRGGGWMNGDKADYQFLGDYLAANGVNAALVNYRHSPAVVHPAHIKDVVRTFKEIKKAALRYNFSLDRVVVGGHSAGAFMAALIGTDEDYNAKKVFKIAAIVGLAGVYDLRLLVEKFPAYKERFVGVAFGMDEKAYDKSSPTKRAISSKIPWLVVQSSEDEMVDQSQALALVAHLRAEKVPVTYIEKKTGKHMEMLVHLTRANSDAEQFLAFIKNKK